MKKLIIIILVFSSVVTARAGVLVTAKIDSMEIFIGEQVRLTVDVVARRNANVKFPDLLPRNYFTPGVEIVDVSRMDTTMADDDGMMTVSKTYTLTSFDEKLYPLPGVRVDVDGKQYTANQLALKVMTLDVDTLHSEKFFPPKDVQDNPFEWSEWRGLFWVSFVVVMLCAICGYLVMRLKQNKPIITHIRIVKRVLPHQKALKAIGLLKTEKVTSVDGQKAYYTQLTDALRQYIKERFGFNAMEMTSSEIIVHLQQAGDREMIDELKELFFTADLVKFAKYSAMMNENDLNLVNAINFIDRTKIEGQSADERIVRKLTEDDIKTKQNRVIILTLIGVSSAIILILLGYVMYNVYLLMV